MTATASVRALTLAGLLLAASAQAQPARGGIVSVEVFANSAMPITPEPGARVPYTLHIYRLDALQRIEQSISAQLPQTEAEARIWLQANQARIKREVTPQAIAAARGIGLAKTYAIKRLPAIVINRKIVVYGLTDVDAAIGHYLASPASRAPAAGGRS